MAPSIGLVCYLIHSWFSTPPSPKTPSSRHLRPSAWQLRFSWRRWKTNPRGYQLEIKRYRNQVFFRLLTYLFVHMFNNCFFVCVFLDQINDWITVDTSEIQPSQPIPKEFIPAFRLLQKHPRWFCSRSQVFLMIGLLFTDFLKYSLNRNDHCFFFSNVRFLWIFWKNKNITCSGNAIFGFCSRVFSGQLFLLQRNRFLSSRWLLRPKIVFWVSALSKRKKNAMSHEVLEHLASRIIL